MHQIRYFLAVSETLNLTRAAQQCNVAQPSLTRAIKTLEMELGGELIRRERALSHLTELGRRMLPMLRQCYETALSAKMVAQSIKKGEATPISLAVSDTVPLAPFIPAFRELSRAFPGLQLRLRRGLSGEVVKYLQSGTVDLAIAGPLSEAWPRFDASPLFEEPFDLLVSESHAFADRGSVAFKDLASEKMLINSACEMVDELRAALKANGIVDAAAHEVATQEDLLALVGGNLGIAIVPVGAMKRSGLRRVALNLNLVRVVSAYTVAGRHRTIGCSALLTILRATDWTFDDRTGQ